MTDLSPSQLARTQMELEYALRGDFRIAHKSESTQHAKLVVYTMGDHYDIYISALLSSAVVQRIQAADRDNLFWKTDFAYSVLDEDPTTVWRGSSYLAVVGRRPRQLHPVTFEDGKFVARNSDRIVSSCYSYRENPRAAEAIVETVEPFRRQGYGRAVTAAWASGIVRSGRTPFYSHKHDNKASQKLAESLAFRKFCDVVSYD